MELEAGFVCGHASEDGRKAVFRSEKAQQQQTQRWEQQGKRNNEAKECLRSRSKSARTKPSESGSQLRSAHAFERV